MHLPMAQRPGPGRVTFAHTRSPFAHIAGSGSGKHHGLLWHLQSHLVAHEPALAVNFSGTWIKDKARSSSMEDALSVMRLGTIMRQAIRLIKGVEITQTDDTFKFAVFSIISWFKVSEVYKLDGSESTCRRRDFRGGKHRGSVRPTGGGGQQLEMDLRWDDPHGGTSRETFTLPSPDELRVHTELTVGGKTVEYTSVFNRKR